MTQTTVNETPFDPTVGDLMRASYQNTLAREVSYTGPILKGGIGTFIMHSFAGAFLMGINPLLGLLSLTPTVLGVMAAIQSGQDFHEAYAESIEHPEVWREFVSPDLLAGCEELLNTPVSKVVEKGLSRRLGKILPPNRMQGATQVTQPNSPATSLKTATTASGTGSSTTSPTTEAASANGKTASGATGSNTSPNHKPIPVQTVELDEAAPHLFMVGRTREGKSETLKHLIGGEEDVWYITSKATDMVPQHWKGYRVGGPDLPGQITWLLSQWDENFLLHLEKTLTHREWFVIDEAVGILKSLETKGAKGVSEHLRGFVVEVITSGAGVGGLMGILSQTGNAGPIKIDEDLLKNCSMVGCGKRKKPQMLKAFLKLTDLKVSAEQKEQIENLDGYWQLWENNGVCLSQVPLSDFPLKEVEVCPVDEEWARLRDEAQSKAIQKDQGTLTLEEKIIRHLAKHGEAKTVRDIRNAVTYKGEKDRASTDEIRVILEQLVNLEKVQKWADGSSERYQISAAAQDV